MAQILRDRPRALKQTAPNLSIFQQTSDDEIAHCSTTCDRLMHVCRGWNVRSTFISFRLHAFRSDYLTIPTTTRRDHRAAGVGARLAYGCCSLSVSTNRSMIINVITIIINMFSSISISVSVSIIII